MMLERVVGRRAVPSRDSQKRITSGLVLGVPQLGVGLRGQRVRTQPQDMSRLGTAW